MFLRKTATDFIRKFSYTKDLVADVPTNLERTTDEIATAIKATSTVAGLTMYFNAMLSIENPIKYKLWPVGLFGISNLAHGLIKTAFTQLEVKNSSSYLWKNFKNYSGWLLFVAGEAVGISFGVACKNADSNSNPNDVLMFLLGSIAASYGAHLQAEAYRDPENHQTQLSSVPTAGNSQRGYNTLSTP